MKTEKEKREIIRIIVSKVPVCIKNLRFDSPKENSNLEEYLLFRYKKYFLTKDAKDIELLIIAAIDEWKFNQNNKNLKVKLEKFLDNLESKLFIPKATVYKEWFKYIWPLLIALISSLFTFLLNKIFK